MARLVFAVLLLAVATASASNTRVVGGTPTTIDRYPSLVQIQSSFTGIWRQTCAGSILTSRFILSSSTCFMGPSFTVRLRRVIAGSSIRNTGGQVSAVARAVQHPSWHVGANLDGDIAVVQLQTPLQFTPLVQQASILGQGAFVPDNMPAVQVGWGVTLNEEFPSLYASVLQRLDVFTVNNERCALNYATKPPFPLTVTRNMICAGSRDDTGACLGDSGAPLYINNIVVGVVSWRWGCTNSSLPTVHTAVPSYTNWIVENVV